MGGIYVSKESSEDIEITSEVIEIEIDYTNMPLYCSPENYKIVKVPAGFQVQLPHGTRASIYKTVNEAQASINRQVKRSKQKWIDSGGKDF